MKEMKPQISVLMTTWNRADWLPHALDSMLGQEGVGFEVVVVDDGSRDNTREVLCRYESDARVVIRRHEQNLGQAQALATAFASSWGWYLTKLDDDDELEPGMLATLAAVLDERPGVDVVYSDWHVEFCDDMFGGRAGERRMMRAGPVEELLQHNVMWSWMCRREVWAEHGGFNPHYGPAADYDFWLRVHRSGRAFAVVHTPLYLYRYHNGNMTWCDRQEQVRLAAEAQRANR